MSTQTPIPTLDYHIVDACNLSCDHCLHFSHFAQPANIQTPEQAHEEWSQWVDHIVPLKFILIGGEPTLNRNLIELMSMAFDMWPKSQVELWSNGHRLDMFTDRLLPLMAEHKDRTRFVMSLHFGDDRDTVQTDKLKPYQTAGVPVRIIPHEPTWEAAYQPHTGRRPSDVRPHYANRPDDSWRTCRIKHCYQLTDGKIWKCPPVAHFRNAGLDPEHWPEFEKYQPLNPGEDVAAWLAKESEPICSHCPAHRRHVPTVQIQKKR